MLDREFEVAAAPGANPIAALLAPPAGYTPQRGLICDACGPAPSLVHIRRPQGRTTGSAGFIPTEQDPKLLSRPRVDDFLFDEGRDSSDQRKGNSTMLWTIAVILLLLWAVGLVSSYTLGGFIHVLLVLAIIVVSIRVIQDALRSCER